MKMKDLSFMSDACLAFTRATYRHLANMNPHRQLIRMMAGHADLEWMRRDISTAPYDRYPEMGWKTSGKGMSE